MNGVGQRETITDPELLTLLKVCCGQSISYVQGNPELDTHDMKHASIKKKKKKQLKQQRSSRKQTKYGTELNAQIK